MRFKTWWHFSPMPGKMLEVEHEQKLFDCLNRQI
jgi:hypothetical protein